MIIGVLITSLDVLGVLYLQQHRFRYVEVLVVLLIVGIAGAFAVELWLSQPAIGAVLAGFVPTTGILRDRDMLYIALGDPRRDRHAAQPVSALVNRADPKYGDTEGRPRQRDPLRDARLDRRRSRARSSSTPPS